ncbi:hypothetical protein AN958_02040 [Leucoagaricus sp. SymC.cos]|nr:hypothetical protein AN958_02040 [Leucoagaricus sp. SymC.cos]
MRFAWVLLSLYAFLSVTAVHLPRQNSLNKPKLQATVDPSRQHNPARDATDICALVDLDLLADLEPLVGLKFPDRVSTESNVCLCTKGLDFFLDTNTDLVSLADLIGRDTLSAYLKLLIDTSKNMQECEECAQDLYAPHTYRDPNVESTSASACLSVDESDSCGKSLDEAMETDQDQFQTSGVNHCQVPEVDVAPCAGHDCIVESCLDSSFSFPKRDVHIQRPRSLSHRMKRIKTRETQGNSGVTLDIHVVIDLAHLLRALQDLRVQYNSLPRNATKETSIARAEAEEIILVTTDLFMSRSIKAFFSHAKELWTIAKRAEDRLSTCEFAELHELDGLRADVRVFIDLTTDILRRCRNSTHADELEGSTSEMSLIISLDQLFGDLGLGEVKAVVKAQGGSTVGEVLDTLAVSSEDESQEEAIRDLGIGNLIEQVENLVGVVFKLGDSVSLLSLRTKSSADYGALAPVSLATLGLMTSTSISGLSNNADLLVRASTDAHTALSMCPDCDNLVDKLSFVIKTAIALKATCEEFPSGEEIELPFPIPILEPTPPSSPTSAPVEHTSTADTLRQHQGAPVVIVLDGLLHDFGFAGVSANMTIGGLSPKLSGALNGILGLLNAGGKKLTRREGAGVVSAVFLDTDLAKAFTTAVEGANDLELKSASPGPVATLLAGLMPPVLASLQSVLGSPTITGLISAVDGLLGAAKEMDKSLTDCNCTTVSVLESSGRFVASVMEIQGWIEEHPDVVRTDGADE